MVVKSQIVQCMIQLQMISFRFFKISSYILNDGDLGLDQTFNWKQFYQWKIITNWHCISFFLNKFLAKQNK